MLFGQLQDKATLLTAERKKRGKTIPEGLASAEDIRGYHQVASHVVCCMLTELEVQLATSSALEDVCGQVWIEHKYLKIYTK